MRRCSTDAQDLTAQPEELDRLGVAAERTCVVPLAIRSM
jgi:hypothetical protein